MDWVNHGTLKQQNNFYRVRRLILADIPSLLVLQNIALKEIENTDTLQPLNLSEFEYILKGNGLMIGAFVEEELIAFRALLIPPIDEEHLGLALGLENKLEEIIYQEISVVHPLYRGNQLQQKLAILITEELTKKTHSFTYICATVAPHNIPSLKDKFKQKMMIGALIDIYGGKLRYVFYKEINKLDEPKWKSEKNVPASDVNKQKELLHDGWTGIQLIQDENTALIKYVKLNNRMGSSTNEPFY